MTMRWLGIAFLALLVASAARATTYYVSPTGSGAAPCVIGDPCSLATAKTAVRARIAAGLDEVVSVKLRGGTYVLTEGLTFGPEDSGAMAYNVTWAGYPGEIPVISGMVAITGWEDQGGGIFRADVGTSWNFRHLYVNGVHANRARGAYNPAGWARSAGGYTAPDGSMAAWGNKSDIEIAAVGAWTVHRCPVDTIVDTAVTMQTPCWTLAQLTVTDHSIRTTPSWVENAYELLDAAEEWYLDRTTGYVYYKPTSGSMSGLTMTAPYVAAPLVDISGASNMSFVALSFQGANWMDNWENGVGFIGEQGPYWTTYATAMSNKPGLVQVSGSSGITLAADEFTGSAATAIRITTSSDITIEGAYIVENAGGGIHIGDGMDCTTTMSDSILVRNPYIASSNYFDYYGDTGYFNACGQGNTLDHGDLRMYYGWSIINGFNLGGVAHLQDSNAVTNTYVGDFCRLFPDCGPFYQCQSQSLSGTYPTGLQMRRNFAEQTATLAYQCYYSDNNSTWITGTENLCIGASTAWLIVPWATSSNQTWTGNYTNIAGVVNAGSDMTISGNTTITGTIPEFGTPAQSIACAAGLAHGATPGNPANGRAQRYTSECARLDRGKWPTFGTAPSSGLIAHWPFNEGRGNTAYNVAGSGFLGAWVGAAGQPNGHYIAGRGGQVAGFNGSNNQVNVTWGGTSLLSATGDWTVAGWFYPTAGGYGFLFSQMFDGWAGAVAVWPVNPIGKLRLLVNAVGGYGAIALNTTNSVTLNEWHFFVASRSGATFSVQLDNVAPATSTDADAGRELVQLTNCFGCNLGGGGAPSYFYPGRLSDLRIYNRALSAAEITALYNAGR